METSLSIIYTANLRGDLKLLPRLHTFIQQIKQELPSSQSHPPLLLDLGRSCVPEVWPCSVTGGRSTLIVLDAMGFHAANIEGVIAPPMRHKIEDQVTLGLIDRAHPWTYNIPPVEDTDICVTTYPQDDTSHRLQICITPSDTTRIEGNILYLEEVKAGEIGVVELRLDELHIVSMRRMTPPAGTHVNPTIAGSVEFVEDEARYYEKVQRDKDDL